VNSEMIDDAKEVSTLGVVFTACSIFAGGHRELESKAVRNGLTVTLGAFHQSHGGGKATLITFTRRIRTPLGNGVGKLIPSLLHSLSLR